MDKRWHFGGPYGYEFDCQIIPPVGSGLASRLESQAGVFLGQLEEYRRANNLQSLTWYAQDSAGNFYEYGVIMGRPYAVIHVAPVGAPEITGNPYQPAIAYLFPVVSSDIGNTIHYAAPDWVYVKHPDNRSTTHEKFYGRLYGGLSDATMYDTRLLHYKGGGFLLGNNSSYDAAGVTNDPTPQQVVSDQTVGHIVAFLDLGTSQQVWVGDLPAIDKWKTFSTYDATDYPEVPMGFQGTISAYNVINLCHDKPYVCTFRNNAGVSTIETFRLSAEGASPALSLVSSVAAASADTVDLRPHVSVSITSGPAFSRPYSEFSVTGAPFDTGSAIVSTDYQVLASDSDGVTAHWTIGFSETKNIADFATDCHNYASSLSTDLAQVSGTVTRECTADTLFKVAEYATSYAVVRHEDFYSPDNPPSDTTSYDSANYIKSTEESTFSATYGFTGTICGLPYTLAGNETLTRSRQIEEALYQTSVTDNGAGGVDVVWRGGLPFVAPPGSFLGDANNTLDKHYTRSMQVARCLFSDRRFGAAVVVEAEATIDVVELCSVLKSQSGDNFAGANDGVVFHASPVEDYISAFANNLEPNSGNSYVEYTSITKTVDSQTAQDLVLYYGNAEVYRTRFYDKTVSVAGVDSSQSVDLIESIAINQAATAVYCSLPEFGPNVSTSQCVACANESGMVVRFMYQDESGTNQQLFVDTHGDNWKTEAGDASSVSATAAAKMFRV